MLDSLPFPTGYAGYALALISMWGAFGLGRYWKEHLSARKQQAAADMGSVEPPSLHPVIDPARCIGCGACTHACPEGKIIGLLAGKATLLDPASCIGHGACKTACPTNAIDLVFGTARRGVDIPVVSSDFQSSVPGIFIAGELGGMGLIANAIEQGRQAIEHIRRLDGIGTGQSLDVVIVGSGPAGFSASLAAKEKGLRAVTLEQSNFGGTVANYPKGKIVMTRPARLPMYGKFKFRRVRKERLLAFWRDVATRTKLQVSYGECVLAIERAARGFVVVTSRGSYATRAVLLATGRRGAPRKLGVPGEHLPKVVYGLADAAQYRGQRVLVVGGGDSAIESALELARRRAADVVLSYRGQDFHRAKPANRQRLSEAEAAGRLQVVRSSNVVAIDEAFVDLSVGSQRYRVANDAVIVCAGGLLPMALLNAAGVSIETKYGVA